MQEEKTVHKSHEFPETYQIDKGPPSLKLYINSSEECLGKETFSCVEVPTCYRFCELSLMC